jgi:hypothetical protein
MTSTKPASLPPIVTVTSRVSRGNAASWPRRRLAVVAPPHARNADTPRPSR